MTALMVKYFTYLKHTALDRLQVRLNVYLVYIKPNTVHVLTFLCLFLFNVSYQSHVSHVSVYLSVLYVSLSVCMSVTLT